MRLRRSLIYVIIITFTGLSSGLADAEIDKKVTDLFGVNWESVRYNRSVSRYNLEVSSNEQNSRASESLSLSGQILIKDPNLVLGTCQQGVITEMTDRQGRNIESGQELPQSRNMSYEGLRYRQRYTQPPKLPRWKNFVRSILRIRPASFRPERINELQPARLDMQLDIGLLGSSGGQITEIKGYYFALMAESVEYVEVPFEPNDNWIRLTDDLEIMVQEAECATTSSRIRYNYNIQERRTGDDRPYRLTVEDYLPERIVTDRHFVGADGKPIDRFMGISRLPGRVGGGGSGSRSDSRGVIPIEKIRFVIAVNPSHYKVPFEFKNIPLPDPELRQDKNQ